jgi:hypothetical protein
MPGRASKRFGQPKRTGLTKKTAAHVTKPEAAGQNSGVSLRRRLSVSPRVNDEYSRTLSGAVWGAIHAGQRGEPIDRITLAQASRAIILFLLQTAGEKEYHEIISMFATLSIELITRLDSIIRNSGDDDESLIRLRAMAQERFAWPTMVRPGDPKFSDAGIEKLEVGKNSIVRRAPTKRGASFTTPRNRLVAELLTDVCLLAQLTPRDGGAVNELVLTMIKGSMMAPNDQRTNDLLTLLKEIRQFLLRQSWPLTKDTVKQWNRWLPRFVLTTDPQLVKHPELKQVRSGKKASISIKTESADHHSRLQKFFHPALLALAR